MTLATAYAVIGVLFLVMGGYMLGRPRPVHRALGMLYILVGLLDLVRAWGWP